jgi:hypothetical protein
MGRIVTEFTIRGKTRLPVIWIHSGFIILHVAVHTLFGRIEIFYVALGTIEICVSALEHPVLIVGKINISPAHSICSMTHIAVSVKTQLFVIRIFGIEVIFEMAKNTNTREPFVLAAAVAVGTIDHRVLSP